MNKYKQAHIFCKAKARCFFIIMCFHLVLGQVPGPCRHSVTQEHLLNLERLIDNQLQNGCSITYTFMERHGLSEVCYVKAAFPQILELLNKHFQYTKDSDNYGYVDKLKNLVLNIYSEECIPEINEEIEDNPVRFEKVYSGSLREALEKIKEVIQLYMELMRKHDKPVDWNCEEEYAEDYPESTTALAQTTGATECHCSCPTLGYGDSEQVSLPSNGKTKPMEASQWEDLVQPSQLQSHSSQPPKLAQPPMGTRNPWDYIPVDHDYNSHHRLRETESVTSVSKEEKEEANGDISSSSPFLAFPGVGNLRSTAGPSAYPGASWHRVHLDPVPGTPGTSESLDASQPTAVPTESMRGTEVSVSHVVSEKRSPTAVSSAFTQSPTQNPASGSTGSQSSQRTSFLDSSRVIIPSSQEHADNPTAPVPSREAPVRSTPTKPEDTTAVLLAKRSLGPRVSPGDPFRELNDRSDVSQAGERTRSTINTVPLPRRTIEETSGAVAGLPVRQFDPPVPPPVLKHESVSMRTTHEKVKSPGLGPQGSAEPADSHSPSEQAERGSGGGSQNGAEGEGRFSYKIAFIAASACGGLMLLITLYCFRKQKKLKALLHSAEVEGNQRLTSSGKDIEMQDFETELSCLDSS